MRKQGEAEEGGQVQFECAMVMVCSLSSGLSKAQTVGSTTCSTHRHNRPTSSQHSGTVGAFYHRYLLLLSILTDSGHLLFPYATLAMCDRCVMTQ